jgi:hypothetical protein
VCDGYSCSGVVNGCIMFLTYCFVTAWRMRMICIDFLILVLSFIYFVNLLCVIVCAPPVEMLLSLTIKAFKEEL